MLPPEGVAGVNSRSVGEARHAMSTKCDGLLGQVVLPLSKPPGCR